MSMCNPAPLSKICFPHCMFPIKATVPGLKGITFPDVCPEQPKGNSVFCPAHLQVAQERQYLTDLRGFLKYCKIGNNTPSMLIMQSILMNVVKMCGLVHTIIMLLLINKYFHYSKLHEVHARM